MKALLMKKAPLAAMCLLVLALNLFGVAGLHRVNAGICIFVLVAVLLSASWELVHCALFFVLMSITGFVLTWLKLPAFWLVFLLPLILSTLIILPFPATRRALAWMKLGVMDRYSWLLVLLTSVLSVVALLVWAYRTDNLGYGAQSMQAVLHYPGWSILYIGVPVFALINAALEEVVYRGILQEALMHVLTQKWFIVLLQASAFAAAHFAAGFPNGTVGYLMVFVWGTMLGYLRLRTHGLCIPYLAHVIADLAIGYALYWYSV